MKTNKYLTISRTLRYVLMFLCLWAIVITILVCNDTPVFDILLYSAIAVVVLALVIFLLLKKEDDKNLCVAMPYFLSFALCYFLAFIESELDKVSFLVLYMAIVAVGYLINLYVANYTKKLLFIKEWEYAAFKAHSPAIHKHFSKWLGIVAISFMIFAIIPFSGFVGLPDLSYTINNKPGGETHIIGEVNWDDDVANDIETTDAKNEKGNEVLGYIVFTALAAFAVWSVIWLVRLIFVTVNEKLQKKTKTLPEWDDTYVENIEDIRVKKKRGFDFFTRDPEKLVRKAFRNTAYHLNDDCINTGDTPSELLKEKSVDSKEYELRKLYEKVRYSNYQSVKADADYAKTLYTSIKKANAR